MSNGNGKRRANNRTGKRQASKGSRAKAASAPSPKRKGLSQDVVDNVKRQVIFGERVGFKNPPKETRFKKGQSGNPKGRPKKTDDVGPGGKDSMTTIILKEGARKVTIREGDETKEIPAIEAVSRAQYLLAIKNGSAYAQKHIIERFDRAEREVRREIKEDCELATSYKERTQALFAEAEKSGEPPPDILPHPDDVVIDYEKGVRFIGPTNKEEAAKMEETIKLRALHLMQHVLEERQSEDLDGPDRPGTAVLIAMLLDMALPPRLRFKDFEMQMRMWPYQGMTKRKLLKELRRAWREVGAPRPRGWTYPPQWWGQKFFTELFDMVAEISSGEGDGTAYIDPLNTILREGFGRKKAA